MPPPWSVTSSRWLFPADVRVFLLLVLTQFVEWPTLDFRHLAGTKDKPYIVETMGSGLALFDYDLDSDLDVYFVSGSTLERLARGEPGEPNRLFRNDGGWGFTDVTEEARIGDRGFGQGVSRSPTSTTTGIRTST